jgi:DNA-binding response OmpR family regulator
MLTAHSERSRVLAARDAGANEFCCKPVTAIELRRKLTAIINHPRPFIKISNYFGPDRRRHNDSKYVGPERREGWSADHKPPKGKKFNNNMDMGGEFPE